MTDEHEFNYKFRNFFNQGFIGDDIEDIPDRIMGYLYYANHEFKKCGKVNIKIKVTVEGQECEEGENEQDK